MHQVRLEATYKALQRRLHPDKYSTASPVSSLPPLHMLHRKPIPRRQPALVRLVLLYCHCVCAWALFDCSCNSC